MALKIVWTPQAESGLEQVLDYLEIHQTKNEIIQLESKLKGVLKHIQKYPKIYPKTIKYKDVHKALIDKNNYIIYRINPGNKIIEIINFRGTKQKPLK